MTFLVFITYNHHLHKSNDIARAKFGSSFASGLCRHIHVKSSGENRPVTWRLVANNCPQKDAMSNLFMCKRTMTAWECLLCEKVCNNCLLDHFFLVANMYFSTPAPMPSFYTTENYLRTIICKGHTILL